MRKRLTFSSLLGRFSRMQHHIMYSFLVLHHGDLYHGQLCRSCTLSNVVQVVPKEMMAVALEKTVQRLRRSREGVACISVSV
jgi:hypothetical protein